MKVTNEGLKLVLDTHEQVKARMSDEIETTADELHLAQLKLADAERQLRAVRNLVKSLDDMGVQHRFAWETLCTALGV